MTFEKEIDLFAYKLEKRSRRHKKIADIAKEKGDLRIPIERMSAAVECMEIAVKLLQILNKRVGRKK